MVSVGETKALSDLATAGCALLRLCLPEEVVEVPTFSHVLSFPLPEPVLVNGCNDQDEDVEHSQEEDALGGEGTSDEGLEDGGEAEECLIAEEQLAVHPVVTDALHQVLSSSVKAQRMESTGHSAEGTITPEDSQRGLCSQQIPKLAECSTEQSAACQEDCGLLFVKSMSPLRTGPQLLMGEDSEKLEPAAPDTVHSGAVLEEDLEEHSVFALPLQPPSRDNSDTSLSHKDTRNASSNSSASSLPGQGVALSQFDRFFPEISNGCFPLDGVVLETESGPCSSGGEEKEEGDEVVVEVDKEQLTVESVSTSELLTADKVCQPVCEEEDTGSKEEVQLLQEGLCVCVCELCVYASCMHCTHVHVLMYVFICVFYV